MLVVVENDDKLLEHLLHEAPAHPQEILFHAVNRAHSEGQALALLDAVHLVLSFVQETLPFVVRQIGSLFLTHVELDVI